MGLIKLNNAAVPVYIVDLWGRTLLAGTASSRPCPNSILTGVKHSQLQSACRRSNQTAVTARIGDYIVRTARNRALPSATRS